MIARDLIAALQQMPQGAEVVTISEAGFVEETIHSVRFINGHIELADEFSAGNR